MKKLSTLLIIILIMLSLSSVQSAAARPLNTILGITMSTDTRVDQNNSTLNYNTNVNVCAGEADSGTNAGRYALYQYSLASVPAGAVISNVLLMVYISVDISSNARDFTVNVPSTSWDAATVTYNTRPTAGASLGSLNFTATETVNSLKQWTLDATYFQNVLTGSESNVGLMVQNSTNLNDAYCFHSLENGNSAYFPILRVTYTIPPTPTITHTPIASDTPTITFTPSFTPTITFTPSHTPTFTFTPTITDTVPGPTNTFTDTPTPTNTGTDTPSPTITFTPTDTLTPTITFTPSITPTLGSYATAYWSGEITYGDASTVTAISLLCMVVIIGLLAWLVITTLQRRRK